MSIGGALRAAAARLVDEPQPDRCARELLALVLGVDHAALLGRLRDPIDADAHRALAALVDRVAAGEPLAYVLGEQPFLDFSVAVTPAVLIPRPETEGLAEWAIRWARARAQAGTPVRRVLDVGTGSGVLAIALARACPDASVVATDLSPDALAVASANARRLDCAERIAFVLADLWPSEPVAPFDLVLANLPYIGLDEVDDVGPTVLGHEPHQALFAGHDGLDLLRRLLAALPARLAPGGAAILEIGWRQGPRVLALAEAPFPRAVITLGRDLFDRPRWVTIETAP